MKSVFLKSIQKEPSFNVHEHDRAYLSWCVCLLPVGKTRASHSSSAYRVHTRQTMSAQARPLQGRATINVLLNGNGATRQILSKIHVFLYDREPVL